MCLSGGWRSDPGGLRLGPALDALGLRGRGCGAGRVFLAPGPSACDAAWSFPCGRSWCDWSEPFPGRGQGPALLLSLRRRRSLSEGSAAWAVLGPPDAFLPTRCWVPLTALA